MPIIKCMSPIVIGSFAALDAAVIAQVGYALRDYQRRSAGDSDDPSPSEKEQGKSGD